MTMYQNINQFGQVSIKGALDLQITNSRVIAGIISASQATALTAGMRVKLDTAAQVGTPSFIAAADSDQCQFIIVYNTKQDSFSAGEAVEVVYSGGPVMYMEAAAAFSAGATVEGAGTGATVQAFSAGKKVGIALDGASAAGQLARVIIMTPGAIA